MQLYCSVLCKCILLHNTLWVMMYADLMLGTECACRQQWWRAAKDGGTHKHQSGWQGTSYLSTYIPFFLFCLNVRFFHLDHPTLFLLHNLNSEPFFIKKINFSLTNESLKRSGSCFLRMINSKRQAHGLDSKRQTD